MSLTATLTEQGKQTAAEREAAHQQRYAKKRTRWMDALNNQTAQNRAEFTDAEFTNLRSVQRQVPITITQRFGGQITETRKATIWLVDLDDITFAMVNKDRHHFQQAPDVRTYSGEDRPVISRLAVAADCTRCGQPWATDASISGTGGVTRDNLAAVLAKADDEQVVCPNCAVAPCHACGRDF